MYVVIGASGNTGSVVANTLLDQGKKVRVIGRHAERLQPFVARGAEPFIADVADADALTRAFNGAEGVYAMIPPMFKVRIFAPTSAPSPKQLATLWRRRESGTP
jgi:uncharacterized protein YbjT (DUF2867 family)